MSLALLWRPPSGYQGLPQYMRLVPQRVRLCPSSGLLSPVAPGTAVQHPVQPPGSIPAACWPVYNVSTCLLAWAVYVLAYASVPVFWGRVHGCCFKGQRERMCVAGLAGAQWARALPCLQGRKGTW